MYGGRRLAASGQFISTCVPLVLSMRVVGSATLEVTYAGPMMVHTVIIALSCDGA
jgi:hypothetical protein